MKKVTLFVLITVVIRLTNAQDVPPLRELADPLDLYIGAAINTDALRLESYSAVAAREFNIVTPENVFKYGLLSPRQGSYRWRDADRLVDFAEANAMRVHGHVLVWHNQQPGWLIEDNFTPEELAAILEDHIKTTVGRYKGRIHEWDVVNEAITDNGQMRSTIWSRALGPDYIAKAFQWAHEADPDALLYYNDYNADVPGRKTDAIYEMVSGLLADGVPIHGVGLQMHLTHTQRRAIAAGGVSEVMAMWDELGLRVAVTEMDVRIHNDLSDRERMLAPQAEIYTHVAQACVAAPNCDTFIVWGVGDAYSWIPDFTGNDDWPLLFDEDLQPKPAYFAVADVLAAAGAVTTD